MAQTCIQTAATCPHVSAAMLSTAPMAECMVQMSLRVNVPISMPRGTMRTVQIKQTGVTATTLSLIHELDALVAGFISMMSCPLPLSPRDLRALTLHTAVTRTQRARISETHIGKTTTMMRTSGFTVIDQGGVPSPIALCLCEMQRIAAITFGMKLLSYVSERQPLVALIQAIRVLIVGEAHLVTHSVGDRSKETCESLRV